MSHYRDLNKELVEQVLSMRNTMKLYCDEIVYLKGELMQKHESHVFLKKKCYNWAVNNFVKLIEYVEPNGDILEILKKYINPEEGVSNTSPERSSARKSSDSRRRSTHLSRDFQRSSSVIQLRKSVCTTSPVRSNNYEASGDEEENIPAGTEELPNTEVSDYGVLENEKSRTPRNTEIEIIFEESDEEQEQITGDESVYESVEESVNISEKRSALSNITNAPVENINRSTKVRPKKTKNKIYEKENSDEYATSMDDSDVDVRRRRYMTKRQTKFTDKSDKDIEEETLQEPRRYTNSEYNGDTNKSFSLHQVNGQTSNNEASLTLTSLVLNDITLKNFQDANCCSTPNSRKNSLKDKKSQTTSDRPSRRCKPKNLAEPTLSAKLRNESETKIKQTSSRSKKPKPKSKPKK